MRTLFLFLSLALSATAQIPTEYSLEATLTEGLNEETGQPVFLCTGKTSLPDGSALSAHIYYDDVSPGRDLRYLSVKVKEGRFSATFPIFQTKTLSGTYIVHLLFNPYLQQRSIRASMGQQIREYQVEAKLKVGDETTLNTDRKSVHRELGRKIETLWTIGQDLRLFLAQNPTRETWQLRVKDWHQNMKKMVDACHNVPEYKALKIDDISVEATEDMSLALHQLMETAGNHLGDRNNPEHATEMTKLHRMLDIIRHDCNRRLGLAFANEVERKRLLDTAKEGVLMAGGLYTWLRRDPKATPVVYQARLDEFRKEYHHQIEQLLAGTPAKHHELIRGLGQRANTLFDIVGEARTSRTNPIKKIQSAVDLYLEYAEPVEEQLKG
ncbi:MAG: hypothetical protein QF645_05190 [Planctomycetota bacterium]|nr:hypothetical protein [Planctomycetota bacterium]